MRQLFLITLLLININSFAETKYVAVKGGLNVRSAADVNSAVLTTLPYGTVVLDTLAFSDMVTINNFTTYWIPVQTEKGIGYIVEAYTLPFPPPKEGITEVQDYLQQITEPMAVVDSVYVHETHYGKKTFYRNGFVHDFRTTEIYGYSSLLIPDISIAKAYILMRHFTDYRYDYPADGKFPVKTGSYYNEDHEQIPVRVETSHEGALPERLILNDNDYGITEFIQVGHDVVIISEAGC